MHITRRQACAFAVTSLASLAAPSFAAASSEPALPTPPGLHRDDAFAPGEVVLTFDDGPYPGKTDRVLDLLAADGMVATFFVLGRHITHKSHALLQRMEREGHRIASHSYDHDITMASRGAGAVEHVRAEHEITRVLIELALLATSADDFEAIHRRVIGISSDRHLPRHALAALWQSITERHLAVLDERGHAAGRYEVSYSRPPGGGPYLGRSPLLRLRYGKALAQAGMLNVMWHADAGDVHPDHARDKAFLTARLTRAATRGGVVLIHDFIRHDALAAALAQMARDPAVKVVDIDRPVEDKYRMPAAHVATRFRAQVARSVPL